MFLNNHYTAPRFLLLATLFFSMSVTALESDKTRPILIEADQVDMAEKTGVSTYSGNVMLEQGSIKISADSIVVYTKNKKLQRIIATGNPALFSQQPAPTSAKVEASAQHVEYASTNGMLTLLNNAKMQQGLNSFSGNRIEYDTVNDIMHAQSSQPSSRQSSTQKNQRVRAIIQPETFQKKK